MGGPQRSGGIFSPEITVPGQLGSPSAWATVTAYSDCGRGVQYVLVVLSCDKPCVQSPSARGNTALLQKRSTAVGCRVRLDSRSSTTDMEGRCATRGTGMRTDVPTHAPTAGATGVSGAVATIVHCLTNALRPASAVLETATGDWKGQGQRRRQNMTQRV